MKLATLMLLGLLATTRCPGEPIRISDPKDDHFEPDVTCWGMGSFAPSCDEGVQPIDPRESLGFNKRFYERGLQPAFVASVEDASMVIEGPWDMPYTLTWFESLEGMFDVGEDVEIGGGWGWSVVKGKRSIVAHLDDLGFSQPPADRPTEDGPLVDFFPACTLGERIVYGVVATLGDETVEIAQGERGKIGDWELLFHGAASAPGYSDDCMIVEGYFHGVVSAWTTSAP